MIFNEWRLTKLGDEFELVYGKSLPKTKRIEGDYPVYGSGGITGTHNQFLVRGPGIIIGRKGTVGSVYYEQKDYFPIDTTYYVTPSNKYDLKFMYYFLKTQSLDKMNSHSAVPGLNREEVYKKSIMIPDIKEQKAIADILSSLDEKIELNNQMNETLEEMAQALFKRWFVDFEFPTEEGQPYRSSGGEMIESELGMIPKGWKVSELGELISISSGKRPSKKSTHKDLQYRYPLIGASSIMGYVLEPLCADKILVIGRVGTHGVVQRFFEPVWPSDNTLVIRTSYYEFINQILKKIDYSGINRGSTQPLITQSDVKKIKIVLPTVDSLMVYEEKCSAIFETIKHNQIENVSLSNLRDTLLPKLMSGEIRVSDLEG